MLDNKHSTACDKKIKKRNAAIIGNVFTSRGGALKRASRVAKLYARRPRASTTDCNFMEIICGVQRAFCGWRRADIWTINYVLCVCARAAQMLWSGCGLRIGALAHLAAFYFSNCERWSHLFSVVVRISGNKCCNIYCAYMYSRQKPHIA